MSEQAKHPFKGEFQTLEHAEDFEIHKLNNPEREVELTDGQVKEYSEKRLGITEYHDGTGKNHAEFIRLKKFYQDAQASFGDLLPKAMFVEGDPSGGQEGRSFYVVQQFNSPEFDSTAKLIENLNKKEFDENVISQLLDIQERINAFLEQHANNLPEEWVDASALDPKDFKEESLYSPTTKETKIVNLFRISPEQVKKITGNDSGFEPSIVNIKALKALGLASIVEKIAWALEKSAAKEWIGAENVHWKLNSEKMKQLKAEGQKVMSLTFDDGPNDETEKLLDILKEQGVKATFFLVGSLVKGREDIVRRIIDEGHEIGVHEWAQEGAPPSEITKNPREYAKRFVGPRKDLGDVKRTTELLTEVSGQRPTIGRVAGVHGTLDSYREFQAMGLDIVHGNPYDVVAIPPSKTLDSFNLLKKALSSNGHGRIRIFHIGTMTDKGVPLTREEINPEKGEFYPPDQTLQMIEEYIQKSREQGYDFVKAGEYIK